MDKNIKILVVDDEETICELLRFNLQAEGYDVTTVNSAEEALTLPLDSFSLFLLDIMLGDISGVQLAKILKNRPGTAHTPVIFCSAKDNEEDIVEGLDLGADDYITKPYSLRTLQARIRSVLRRSEESKQPIAQANEQLQYEGLILNITDKLCSVDGEFVKLPRKEFELLAFMLTNKNRIFSREEIINHIWPEDSIVVDRVVDVNIRRLRAKLGQYGKNIQTRTGYGYGFFS